MVEVDRIHQGERNAILQAIMDQSSELHGQSDQKITCPCGVTGPISRMFQCYYCEVHLCPRCADDHFGELGE